MKFNDYIAVTPVFTVESAAAATGSPASLPTQLKRALASGRVERVRRGLYASRVGLLGAQPPDAFAVVAALDPSAVLSYHSALTAHGVAHNVSFTCQFRSRNVRSAFEYGGVRFQPLPWEEGLASVRVRGRAFGIVTATSREQTLVDCLCRPALAGGIEEGVRSLSAIAYLDFDSLMGLLDGAGPTLVARAGWLLELKREAWRVSEDVLAALEAKLSTGPYRLDPGASADAGWSRRWKLLLPEDEGEVVSWTR